MNEIKAGDVVKLKSGGPAMTVTSVGDHYGELSAYCSWFVDNKPQQNVFPVHTLKKVE